MNKKIVIISLIIAALVVGTICYVLFVAKNQRSNENSKQSNSNALQSAKTTIYDGHIFTPNFVNAKKGDFIKVTNLSAKKVMVAITGKQAAPVLTIESGKTEMSPAMIEDGVYNFKDMTDALINLPKPKTDNSSTPKQEEKIVHTTIDVELSNSGFEPAEVNAKKGVIIQLKNSSTVKKTIGAGQTNFDIAPNSSTSLSFDSPGNFTYINEANKSQVLKIVVE